MQSDAKVGRGGAAFVFRFYVQERVDGAQAKARVVSENVGKNLRHRERRRRHPANQTQPRNVTILSEPHPATAEMPSGYPPLNPQHPTDFNRVARYMPDRPRFLLCAQPL